MYTPQEAIKGQSLVYFLADHLIYDDWEQTNKLSNEDTMVIDLWSLWIMHFDGATRRDRDGSNVVFVTL